MAADLTVHNRAEPNPAVATAEQQLLALAATVSGVAIVNAKGQIIYANSAQAALLGVDSAAELIGQPWSVLYALSEGQRFEQNVMPQLRQRGYWHGEASGQRQDGNTYWQEVSLTLMANETWVSVAQDVSDRKQAEAAIERQLALFEEATYDRQRAAVEATIQGIAVLNREGQLIYMNRAYATTWGYASAADLIGQPWQMLYGPEERQRFEQEVIPRFFEAGYWSGEAIGQQPDGTSFPQEVSLTVMKGGGWVWTVQDITERKQAEATLRQSEATNRALVESIPDLLVRVRGDGTIIEAPVSTTRLKRFYGSVTDLTGANIYDTLPPPQAAQRQAAIGRALETKMLQVYEHQLLIDGELVDEEVRVIVTGDDEVLIMIRDITDRKQAEAALRQSETNNRALIEAIPDLLIRMKGDGTYMGIANSDRHAVLNVNESTAGNSSVYDLLPFDVAEQRMHYVRQALQTNQTQFYEQQLEIDGQMQFEEVRIVVTGPEEVLAIVRNITERKRSEEALRIAEENYRSIFENALEGIFQSNPAGQFININPALARIYGYDSPAEMIDSITDINQQIYVDTDHRNDFIEQLAEQNAIKGREFRCYRRDGQIFWAQIDARAVKDNSGNVLYYEGIVQDISERKRREDDLKRQVEQLKIEIDQTKRARQVAEITQSDYFQQLLVEAEALRFSDD